MQIKHTIATVVEGELSEVMNAPKPEPVSLKELLSVLESLAFVAETVAHMHNLERSVLPHTEKARALLARLNPAD